MSSAVDALWAGSHHAESKAAHHAISTLFDTPIDPKGKPLVVQYEVKLQKGLDCGGAYIKLLTESEDSSSLRAGAEYTDKVCLTRHGDINTLPLSWCR